MRLSSHVLVFLGTLLATSNCVKRSFGAVAVLLSLLISVVVDVAVTVWLVLPVADTDMASDEASSDDDIGIVSHKLTIALWKRA